MRLVRYTYPAARQFNPAFGFQRSSWPGLENEIDRLFATTLNRFGASTSAGRFPVDLYEDNNHVYVRAELPGVSREDIDVEMADGHLTLTAKRKTAATEGQAEQTVSFSRSVSIADDVQADQVTAVHQDGVLTVTLPKREEAKPKKITVAVK